MLLLRRVIPFVAVLVVAVAGASPAYASHGGGGGGGGGLPPTPAIQLSPDATSVVSGQSDVVQVVFSPAAPAGGTALSITSSNVALSVPAVVTIPAGSFDGQFAVTANTVAAPTTAVVIVSHGTDSASVTITVTPATAPVIADIQALPSLVASGDTVTVTVSLQATAPPGGAVITLTTDSPALPLPATVPIPAGSDTATMDIVVGPVATTTTAHLTARLATVTVTGQVQIAPARVLTDLALASPSVDGSLGSSGGVTVSVPAAGDNASVTLTSSNPAVAAVPAGVAFLFGEATASFPIRTTPVPSPTPVTITATAGGVSKSAQLIVTPTPPPPFDLQTITIAPAVLAGTGTVTAKVTSTVGAPVGGLTIPLTSSDPTIAAVPVNVRLPAGATSATFPVKVTGANKSAAVGVSALFNGQGPSAVLNIIPSKGGSTLVAGNQNERLAPKQVGDPNGALGFSAGGTGKVESGQLPPGISLVNNIRPGEFVFVGILQKAGTYSFVLEFTGNGPAYAIAYVWVITP